MADGLLLTMMTPAPGADAEFNDWMDQEHIPERRVVPGFQRARRFRNTSSSPRYLTLYDLDDIAVLESEAYSAIAGNNLSPWSKRIAAAASHRARFEGSCIASRGDEGITAGELLLLRWRNVPKRCDADICAVANMAARDAAAMRLYVSTDTGPCEYVALVLAATVFPGREKTPADFGAASAPCDFAQIFAPIGSSD